MFHKHESAIVDEGAQIGKGCTLWHFSHICTGASIGENCVVGQNVYVGPACKVGNGVKIQNNVSVFEGVSLENNVFCGPSVVFTNVIAPRAFINGRKNFQETSVREGASIGANATILCGVTIGKYAFIGAGAVVTKDVPDFALSVGVPAQTVGWVSKAGVRLVFNEYGVSDCPITKERYFIRGGECRLDE